MAAYQFNIDALNAGCLAAGGTGGHGQNIDALNELCMLAGGTGGHGYGIDALNELAVLYGGTGGHRYNIDALNEIATLREAEGGPFGQQVDAYSALVELWGGLFGDDTAAGLLLGNEPSGLAIDFAQESALVRGHTTEFLGTPTDLLTYTSPSPKLVFGSDGVLDYAPMNGFTRSEALDHSDWDKTNLAVTTGFSGPEGQPAFKISSSNTTLRPRILQNLSGVSNNRILLSVKAKAGEYSVLALGTTNTDGLWSVKLIDLSDGSIGIQSEAGGSKAPIIATTEDLGGGWYLCTAYIPQPTATRVFFGPAASDSVDWIFATPDGSSGIYICEPQVAFVTARETRGVYFPTTSAARYSLPLNHDPLTGDPLGILIEGQRTNLALYSRDFTNAAWTKSNLTAAKAAPGPDGVANSASTLTATDANATALQAITSASAARITSMFVKRRTGTGDVDITHDNGSTWTTVVVTNEWTRVENSATTSANPTVGIRIVTSGDEIDVDFFQHETGGDVSSPIPTAGSQVTRAKDDPSLASAKLPFNEEAGTIACRLSVVSGAVGQEIWRVAKDGNNFVRLYNDPNNLHSALANALSGTINARPTQDQLTSGALTSTAAAWATDDFGYSKDGAAATTDTSGELATGFTALSLGGSMHGHIKSLVYLPRRASNAELQGLTA